MRRFYKPLSALLLLLSALLPAHAQLDPLYAQYLNNPMVINPAYAGFNKDLNISVSFRKQWAGIDGTPATFNATAHTSLFDNRMGAGIILVSDHIGENTNTLAMGTYSYKIQMDRTFISFGLQAGVANYRSDNSELNILDPDPYFSDNLNTTKPVFGAGVILSNDNLFLGLSAPRLLKTKGKYVDEDSDRIIEGDVYTQHFYAMASYILFINERLRLKPSVLLKYVDATPLSYDINAVLNIDERYGIGAFTRSFDTYGFLAQARFGRSFRLAYAFELPTGNSVGVNYTSHEITLGLNLAVLDFHDIDRVNSF